MRIKYMHMYKALIIKGPMHIPQILHAPHLNH